MSTAVPTLPSAVQDSLTNGNNHGLANGSANGVAPANSDYVTTPTTSTLTPFSLRDTPVENLRPLKVIVIGAGYSGIYCAIRIPEKLRNVELVVYERNEGVGGTWFENRYLGCACDVPSHSYQYSFEPNKHWSSLYAPAQEIQAYLEGVAEKYGAQRFIKLRHEVTNCRWDAKSAKWHVDVRDLATGVVARDTADVLVSARGALGDPMWPDIDGLEVVKGGAKVDGDSDSVEAVKEAATDGQWKRVVDGVRTRFKGEVMHSARWNESYDFKNKRVGVIGSGSSSIQIVPGLQRLPGTHIDTFVRSKTWISPSFGQELWDKYGFKDSSVSVELRAKFAQDTEYYDKFRLTVEEDGNSAHPITIKGTPLQVGAKEMFYQHMKTRLASKPEIFNALVPSFSPGCRRITPGPGYLEALVQPNVSFITTPISHISDSAIHTTDGTCHSVDAIICATGFHSNAAPPFPVTGAHGTTLQEKWQDRPTTYLSHSISGFPNLFTMLGPNGAIGSGSLTTMIETMGDYIVKCVRKMQKENIAAMEVKREREEDFTEYVDKYFEGTVFGESCRSWYKNGGSGAVVGLWPGSTLHCVEALRSPRWEDFDYVYVDELGDEETVGRDRNDSGAVGGNSKKRKRRANQLAWLGNGWTVNQLEEKDLAWYLYPEFLDRPVAPRPEERERFRIRPFSH